MKPLSDYDNALHWMDQWLSDSDRKIFAEEAFNDTTDLFIRDDRAVTKMIERMKALHGEGTQRSGFRASAESTLLFQISALAMAHGLRKLFRMIEEQVPDTNAVDFRRAIEDAQGVLCEKATDLATYLLKQEEEGFPDAN